MKQCPFCKTNYSDDTLVFCLNDGTKLISLSDEQATQQMSFNPNQIRVEIPSNPSSPTVFSTPQIPQTVETKKSGKGLTLALLAIGLLLLAGAAVAGIVLYNNGSFGKTIATANTSPSPTPANSKTEENTQELKERLANVEKQLNEQKNAKTEPSQTPITKPTTQSNSTTTQTAPTARVAQSNDGYLSLRSAPSAQSGTQILKIPSGSIVELQDCQRNYIVIDSRRGRWCMVSYGGYTGWAFDAWLIY